MSEAGARATGPAANDLYIGSIQRETQQSRQDGELTRLGAILPTLVEAILDRVDDPTNYEPCPHCHRPSWGHVEHLIESARRDERDAIAWEEFTACEEISARELLARLEHIRVMLAPRPKGERLFLRVSA